MKSLLILLMAAAVPGMVQAQDDIPLMLPEEREAVVRQDRELSSAIAPILQEAGKSTVRIWSGSRRLAYGTIIGNGTKILTKWSEIARANRELRVDAAGQESRIAKVSGVYEEEDLVLLEIEGEPMVPVKWSYEPVSLGSFLAAPQPDGRLAGFGVVSVLERNLRDTDLAYLGVVAARGYTGKGVKIDEIQKETGASKAGLKPGDVILKVGERPISGLLALKNALTGVIPGTAIDLRVVVNGDEKDVSVTLGNRPVTPQYFGARLQQMERMGGPISQVRNSFTRVVQTDMRISPTQVGGPVVDLEGRALGITMARADRTRSFVMPAAAIDDLLKRKATDPAVAQVRGEEENPPMMARAAPPQGFSPPKSEDRLRRHLTDMQQLMQMMNEELEALEQP